jgi:hypothetical protein
MTSVKAYGVRMMPATVRGFRMTSASAFSFQTLTVNEYSFQTQSVKAYVYQRQSVRALGFVALPIYLVPDYACQFTSRSQLEVTTRMRTRRRWTPF